MRVEGLRPWRAIVVFSCLALSCPASALAQTAQPGRHALFDAPLLVHGFGLLQTDSIKNGISGGDSCTSRLIDETRKAVNAFIAKHGAKLTDEAFQKLLYGSTAERRRAQLILAQHKTLPARYAKQLARSSHPPHRLWAAWNAKTWERPKEVVIGVEHEPPTFEDGQDPLLQVADEIRQRLKHTPEQLRAFKEEYQASYYKTFLPNLEQLPRHFPVNRRLAVDLDGDGSKELILSGHIPDDFMGVNLTLILKVAKGKKGRPTWSIACWRHWHHMDRSPHGKQKGAPDWIVTDFDGDGQLEAVELTQCASRPWMHQAHYYDSDHLARPKQFCDRQLRIMRLPGDDRPVIVTQGPFNANSGGTAIYLATALATHLRMTRFDRGKAREVSVLVHGNGE